MDLADDNADKPEPHSEDSYFSMGDGPELPTHRLLSHEIEWPLVPPPRRVTGIKGNADDDDQILRPSQSLRHSPLWAFRYRRRLPCQRPALQDPFHFANGSVHIRLTSPRC